MWLNRTVVADISELNCVVLALQMKILVSALLVVDEVALDHGEAALLRLVVDVRRRVLGRLLVPREGIICCLGLLLDAVLAYFCIYLLLQAVKSLRELDVLLLHLIQVILHGLDSLVFSLSGRIRLLRGFWRLRWRLWLRQYRFFILRDGSIETIGQLVLVVVVAARLAIRLFDLLKGLLFFELLFGELPDWLLGLSDGVIYFILRKELHPRSHWSIRSRLRLFDVVAVQAMAGESRAFCEIGSVICGSCGRLGDLHLQLLFGLLDLRGLGLRDLSRFCVCFLSFWIDSRLSLGLGLQRPLFRFACRVDVLQGGTVELLASLGATDLLRARLGQIDLGLPKHQHLLVQPLLLDQHLLVTLFLLPSGRTRHLIEPLLLQPSTRGHVFLLKSHLQVDVLIHRIEQAHTNALEVLDRQLPRHSFQLGRLIVARHGILHLLAVHGCFQGEAVHDLELVPDHDPRRVVLHLLLRKGAVVEIEDGLDGGQDLRKEPCLCP